MCKSRPLIAQGTQRHTGIAEDHLAVVVRDPVLLSEALLQVVRESLAALPAAPNAHFSCRRQLDLLRLQSSVIDSDGLPGSRQMLIGAFGPRRTPLQKIGFPVPLPHFGPKPRRRSLAQSQENVRVGIVGGIPANAEVRDHALR